MPSPSGSRRRGQSPRWQRLALVSLLAATLMLSLLPQTLAEEAAVTQDAVDVKLLAINDFHGRIVDAPYLSTYIKDIKDEHPNTLMVDAGDLVGATPVLSNLFYDEPTVEVMNEIGLDVQTVGNHEFDRGRDELLRRLEGGCLDGDCDYRDGEPFEGQDYNTLAANVFDTVADEPLLDTYEIHSVGGVEIGFIGAAPVYTPTVVHPDGIVNLEFLPEAEAINAVVAEIEDAVDAIVVLIHEGGRQDGGPNECVNFRGALVPILEALDDAVDVVVSGHTHESYVCEDVEGKFVTQAFQYGRMFTEIDLAIEPGVGLVDSSAVNHVVDRDEVDPDPAVQEIVDFYDDLAGPFLVEIVGQSEVAIPRTTRSAESRQGNVATDALTHQFDVDFAFQNSGGLRDDLTFEDDVDDDGLYNIRREYVLDVWPFGNIVVLAEVDGEMLYDILANGVHEVGGGRFIQMSGLRIDYYVAEPDAEPFPRGEILRVEYWGHPDYEDGTPVDLSADASYDIAMNDFMAAGGDAYPVITELVYSRAESLEIAVEEYLMAESPIAPQIEGRIRQVPEPLGAVRVAGADRIETAIEISRATFADFVPEDDDNNNGNGGYAAAHDDEHAEEAAGTLEAESVVLARSTDFADALAGTPLAVEVGAPMLLTPSAGLDARVLAEIERILEPGGTVHLLGGTAALSAAVADVVVEAGFEANRIYGETRFETAVEIAEVLARDAVMITTGVIFPDALAAGAAAAAHQGAVLLTTSDRPHPAVDAYLAAAEPDAQYAVGGPAARAYPDLEAVYGPTREDTAVEVAEAFFDAPLAIGMARRDDYPDALAGGAHIGRIGGPLLLTLTSRLHEAPEAYVCENAASIDSAFVYGGTAAVAEAAMDALAERIAGEGCNAE